MKINILNKIIQKFKKQSHTKEKKEVKKKEMIGFINFLENDLSRSKEKLLIEQKRLLEQKWTKPDLPNYSKLEEKLTQNIESLNNYINDYRATHWRDLVNEENKNE